MYDNECRCSGIVLKISKAMSHDQKCSSIHNTIRCTKPLPFYLTNFPLKFCSWQF